MPVPAWLLLLSSGVLGWLARGMFPFSIVLLLGPRADDSEGGGRGEGLVHGSPRLATASGVSRHGRVRLEDASLPHATYTRGLISRQKSRGWYRIELRRTCQLLENKTKKTKRGSVHVVEILGQVVGRKGPAHGGEGGIHLSRPPGSVHGEHEPEGPLLTSSRRSRRTGADMSGIMACQHGCTLTC